MQILGSFLWKTQNYKKSASWIFFILGITLSPWSWVLIISSPLMNTLSPLFPAHTNTVGCWNRSLFILIKDIYNAFSVLPSDWLTSLFWLVVWLNMCFLLVDEIFLTNQMLGHKTLLICLLSNDTGNGSSLVLLTLWAFSA